MDPVLLLQGNQMRVMSPAFLDELQIDEFEVVDFDNEMSELFEDNWESITETDIEEWLLSEQL